MIIICTKQEQDKLIQLLPCLEQSDFSYFCDCKFRDRFNPETGEPIAHIFFDNCLECQSYHNNIIWNIKDN